MKPLVEEIQKTWREAFKLSGLAGMLYLGKAGLLKAKDHAPKEDGLERYVYFALPHIGLGANGEVGLCYRPGRIKPSKVCGALLAFLEELERGNLSLGLGLDDLEQSILKQRLLKKLKYGEIPDLVTLTKIAHTAIAEELERMIELTTDPQTRSHYAVLTGIAVHGPEHRDYIWPGVLYAVVDGQRYALTIETSAVHAISPDIPLSAKRFPSPG